MYELAPGWEMDVERGPDCLVVRLGKADLEPEEGGLEEGVALAEQLWNLLQQHFVCRLVLEMDQVPFLSSHLIGQLVLLHKRLYNEGGFLRLCGISEGGRQALAVSRLSACFPDYRDRYEAVGGFRPSQPR